MIVGTIACVPKLSASFNSPEVPDLNSVIFSASPKRMGIPRIMAKGDRFYFSQTF